MGILNVILMIGEKEYRKSLPSGVLLYLALKETPMQWWVVHKKYLLQWDELKDYLQYRFLPTFDLPQRLK